MNVIRNWIYDKLISIQIWIAYSQKKNWVSYHAKKIIRNSQNKGKGGFIKSLSEKWFDWMHPQKWAFSLFLAFSFIFIPQFVLGTLKLQNFGFIDTDFLSTIWEVLASIIGISFVIVVFLTEYSQDQTYERRAFPIYISATSMIFTVMFGLLTLMSIGINLLILKSPFETSDWIVGVSIWNAVIFFFNLILTINLYIKTYQLLSPYYFRTILIAYHRKKVLERVYRELFKRVKTNLVIQFLQDEEVEFSIFRDDHKNKVKVISNKIFSEPEVIDDVNYALIKIARQNAKRIDTTFKKDKIIFWGIPDRQISIQYPEIASISDNLNVNIITKPLSRSIKTKSWQSAKLETATEDLLINRDLIAIAIIDGQAENVESSLGLYIETVDAFLDSLQQLGYRFTPELANNEDTWFNRWDIFDTVYQQYISLLKEAFRSNNPEIISSFINFPRKIMLKAFVYKDHLTFKKFASLYPTIYTLTKHHIRDIQTSKQIINRCGLLLAEFINYNIKYALAEDEIKEDKVKELIAYAEEILVPFSELAKKQIDNLDFTEYKLTISTIRRMLSEFINKHDKYKIEHLEFELQYTKDKNSQIDLLQKLEKEKSLNIIATDFDNLVKSALFGLGAWICHKVNSGTMPNEDFDKFTQIICEEFQNIDILNESYTKAISMEDRRIFNWSGWEMDEWQDVAYGESRFGSIHFSSWITTFFTFCALLLTPENTQEFIIKPSIEVKGMLDSIKSTTKNFIESNNWSFLKDKIKNIEVRRKILENSFQAAYEKQITIEELEIIQSPLSTSKIQNFIAEVEKAWQTHAQMRLFFIYYGKYISNPDILPTKKLNPFGHYTRNPKELFLENPRFGYALWGENYGKSLAQGESTIIIGYLKQLPTKPAFLKNFDEEINKQVTILKSKGYNPIILFSHDLYHRIHESPNFDPAWKTSRSKLSDFSNFNGYYKNIPAFSCPTDNSVIICDFSKFGTLVQYKVDQEIPDFPLQIIIKEINQSRAEEYLIKNPKLTVDPNTKKELANDEALRKIQQDVELAIWEKFDVEDMDLRAGIIISFKDFRDKGKNTKIRKGKNKNN